MSQQHRARKRFGQNFLHDQNIIRRIIDEFGASANDTVVEIGPGQGALSDLLLQQLNHLHVVEIDRDLIQALEQRPEYPEKLSIHASDILMFDLNTIQPTPVKIIGNLPYNISTPIIFHLSQYKHLINDMVFMLQKEVVERMLAQPNEKNYGRLSVMSQIHYKIEKLFDVSKHCFTPAPKVMSTVFRLRPRSDLIAEIRNENEFANIVKSAFNHRRKTIRNSLKEFFEENEISRLGISPDSRPETLSIKDFILLANNKYEK